MANVSPLIAQLTPVLTDRDGRRYTAEVHGRERADGMWEGWLVFRSGPTDRRSTGIETEQSTREALRYWSAGVQPIYLEGAFARATRSALAS
jgi:hypothetical protein